VTGGRKRRAETVSVTVSVRLSQAERERIARAARANHQDVSQFQRDALLDRADACLDEARPKGA